MPKVYEIPKACPPDLRALIEKLGTKVKTFNAMGVSKDTFTRVVNGGEKMPAHWPEIIARVSQGGSASNDPVFTPWDGTTLAYTLPNRGGKKGRTFKKAPSTAVELVTRHEGNVSKAARTMGTTSNTLTSMLEGSVEFNDKRQRMVFAGLHGVPSSGMAETKDPDQFLRGIVIVIVNTKNYDRVKDVAELLNGSMLFRKGTTVGWIVFYGMKTPDAKTFKRIASRDCVEIVCP